MRRLIILTMTLAVTGLAQPPEGDTALLKRVEDRYNSTKTLQATFTQTVIDRNRARTPQKGTLYLRKQPSSTRWEYTAPAGDFFLSDGKFTYDYEKATNTVSRAPFKETEDTRVPLSFLLGKLDFNKDFSEFRGRQDPAGRVIEMLPRNKKLDFDKITMLVMPDATIRRVTVQRPGGTSTEYVLDSEQRNLKLPDTLFQFKAPAGAQVQELK
jgi:outer membrane lipoprotein carrier protein